MPRLPRKLSLVPSLMLAVLLLSAQFGSLAHAFEHDPGAPQAKYCSACATASQLSSACVDTHTHQLVMPGGVRHVAEHDRGLLRTTPVLIHQRGPPPPL
jgi:hypothetical protein